LDPVIGNIIIAAIGGAVGFFTYNSSKKRGNNGVSPREKVLEDYNNKLRRQIVESGGTPLDYPKELLD
jgi:hypothetical protein